ncbi:MAG: type II toxin-antitoxin system death-on-curing family toxin [Myxococcaceae bacterium]
MIEYLSLDQVLALHEALVERFGGGLGLRERGLLEAAVARPTATFSGEDLYPDLPAKAAALLHSLVMNHAFVDGNKRVAVAAAELFVEINGQLLVATDGELGELTLSAARGELQAEAIAIWLRQRLAKME